MVDLLRLIQADQIGLFSIPYGFANLSICFISTGERMLRSKPRGMGFGQLLSNLDDTFEQLDDAFQVCVAHGDFARTNALAALSANVISDCQGNDADDIERIRGIIQSLLRRFTM